ncbi:MAG: acyl-ACP desaturase [Kofleriaceae bacterium]
MSDIAQHLAVSHKVVFEDLDFALAKQIGLTEQEVESLLYFADIESQTVHYFLEVSKLKVARDPELLTFLTMWNYEEYFHSYAITHLLTECGVHVDTAHERAQKIRKNARFKAKFEDFGQGVIARSMPKTFIALWMFWGSLQECLTTQAYEELATTTKNPVLAELCKRIAKQERRHFAYYFGQAKKKLEGQPFAQKFVRMIANAFYAPVGGGVKTDAEGAQLVAQLFPKDRIFEVMNYIEKKMALLPGMDGLDCASRWAAKIQPMLSPETRATSIPQQFAAA